MKKILVTAVVLALVAGALSATASAGKKKKAKPVPVTMFFHGTETLGEIDAVNNLSAGGQVLPMDTTEPTATPSKSFPIIDLIATPNEACSGSSILPSWAGNMSGRVTGDVTVTFNTIGSAGTVDIELFADAGPLSCNDTYIDPAAETTIDLPPGSGTVEAVIEGVDFEVIGRLVVMVNHKMLDAPAMGRVLYDSPTDDARIEFTCTPAAGATACT